MKIQSIKVFAKAYPYATLGHGRLQTAQVELQDTLVAIETDTGLTGWGEACPLAPAYLNATTQALRGGIEHLAPRLIGMDPRETSVVNSAMDKAVRGHEAAKAALDIACWDVFGKSVGLPVKTLLGGAETEKAHIYESIATDTPEAMLASVQEKRGRGITVFQVKLGEGAAPDIARLRAIAADLQPKETMICDANRGWTLADARAVVAAANALPPEQRIYIEQPCQTYEESLSIRRACQRPFVMDEVIDTCRDIHKAVADDAIDGIAIKLSHSGGLTKARDMARLAVELGLIVRIEDTVGADIVRAAVAHLAQTVPQKNLMAAYPHPAPFALGTVEAESADGWLTAGDAPGLGFDADLAAVGELIAEYR